jgi:hypothetical protein
MREMTLTELFRPVSVTEIRDAFDCGELHHFRRGSDRNQAEAVMNWEIAAHIAERKAEKPGKLRILNDGVPVPS